MDFLEVIEKRKSVRKYSDRPVEREILDAIVKVAQTAPSSRNSKSSAFMIVEYRDTLDALAQMRDGLYSKPRFVPVPPQPQHRRTYR